MNATAVICTGVEAYSTKNAKGHIIPTMQNRNLALCWGLLAVCKNGKKFEMVVQKSGYTRAVLFLRAFEFILQPD